LCVCVKISSLMKDKNEVSLWFFSLSVYLFCHLLGNLQSVNCIPLDMVF